MSSMQSKSLNQIKIRTRFKVINQIFFGGKTITIPGRRFRVLLFFLRNSGITVALTCIISNSSCLFMFVHACSYVFMFVHVCSCLFILFHASPCLFMSVRSCSVFMLVHACSYLFVLVPHLYPQLQELFLHWFRQMLQTTAGPSYL